MTLAISRFCDGFRMPAYHEPLHARGRAGVRKPPGKMRRCDDGRVGRAFSSAGRALGGGGKRVLAGARCKYPQRGPAVGMGPATGSRSSDAPTNSNTCCQQHMRRGKPSQPARLGLLYRLRRCPPACADNPRCRPDALSTTYRDRPRDKARAATCRHPSSGCARGRAPRCRSCEHESRRLQLSWPLPSGTEGMG